MRCGRSKSEVTEEQYRRVLDGVARLRRPAGLDAQPREAAANTRNCWRVLKHAPMDMWDRDGRCGVKLYVKRVFIMDDADQLRVVPAVRGVVIPPTCP